MDREAGRGGGTLQDTVPGTRGGGAQVGFADGGMSQGGPGTFAPEGLGGMGSGVSAAVHSEYVTVSSQQQRRQPAGGTSASTMTVADIVSGAMVRIVAAKDADSFPAESVQLVAATLTGQSN